MKQGKSRKQALAIQMAEKRKKGGGGKAYAKAYPKKGRGFASLG
jgi:hypothetical protein